MSTLKDKLAQSVRHAKSAAVPAVKQPSAVKQPRAAKRAPAAPTPPAAPAAAIPAGARPSTPAQKPAPEAEALFPRRVWPD